MNKVDKCQEHCKESCAKKGKSCTLEMCQEICDVDLSKVECKQVCNDICEGKKCKKICKPLCKKAYEDLDIPFSEFEWADYLRKRISV